MFQIKVLDEIRTHILSSITVLKIRAFYDIMWRYFVLWGRPQITIWLMCFACWIPKATNTHRGWVILSAFQRERWLKSCAWKLRYPYIICLVLYFRSLIFSFDLRTKNRKKTFSSNVKNLISCYTDSYLYITVNDSVIVLVCLRYEYTI